MTEQLQIPTEERKSLILATPDIKALYTMALQQQFPALNNGQGTQTGVAQIH